MAEVPTIGVHLGPDHVDMQATDNSAGLPIVASPTATASGSGVAHPAAAEGDSKAAAAALDSAATLMAATGSQDHGGGTTGVPGACGSDGSGSLRKGMSTAGAQRSSPCGQGESQGKRKDVPGRARLQEQHLRWLAQAEAAQAVLQSSHEVLQSSFKPQVPAVHALFPVDPPFHSAPCFPVCPSPLPSLSLIISDLPELCSSTPAIPP